MHEQSNEFTGFEFGRRSTGTVVSRIYDKTLQVREKHLDWWFDVWSDRCVAGEQATEDFSIEGQADKLRTYAALHDLGEVIEIADHGWSGTKHGALRVAPDVRVRCIRTISRSRLLERLG